MKPLSQDVASLLVAAVLASGLMWASGKLVAFLMKKYNHQQTSTACADLLTQDPA